MKWITYGLLKGIKAIHKQGTCHRDIIPDNILLSKSTSTSIYTFIGNAHGYLDGFQPKIIDFGVSRKFIGEGQFAKGRKVTMMTQTGMHRYRAPEMIKGIDYE